MGTRCPATIMAYLHVKVVKVSGFEELCPVCGDKVYSFHYGLLTCGLRNCVQCVDKVSDYHYGLLTCESCKGKWV